MSARHRAGSADGAGPRVLPEREPTADVIVTRDEVAVTVALPGLRAEGLHVEVRQGAGNAVHIRGVRHGEHADYLVPLPVAVEDGRIGVRVVNDVVDVTLRRLAVAA